MVARRAHNPKVVGSSPAPATSQKPCKLKRLQGFIFALCLILCVRTEKRSCPWKRATSFYGFLVKNFFIVLKLAQRNRMRIYSAKTTIELCAHGLIYVQLTLSSVSATDKIPALCILSRFSDVESPVKIMRTMLSNTMNFRFAYFPILFL